MEEWESKLIRQNLPELINLTDCNTRLITRLEANGILAKDDVEKLSVPGKTAGEKTKEFYSVMLTRKNGFEHLLNALEETKQSGVLDILNSEKHNLGIDDIRTIKYDENAVLGRGSCGTIVYKGKLGERPVAVKLVHSNLYDGKQTIENEVKVLQACDAHENVVRYFGSKQTGNIILIVLELCDTSLREWVQGKQVDRNIQPIEILRQVTTGLAWLHSQNIVHRDLKPENILLILNLKRVKIADFGISRRMLDGNSFVATSNAGGTPGWMAPEILACMEAENQNIFEFVFTPASDVFSLGCVYYFVLSDGKSAFGDLLRCQGNILDGKSMMMHEHVNHGCSQNLVFINTMISRDPKSRPKCDSLLRLPLFLSQNARLSILETSFESVWNEIKNLNLQGACKFDHTEEIEVLKKIGIDYTHNRCVVTLAYAECLKRGVGERIKISRNNEVGMRKLTDNRSIPRQITRTLDTNGDESLGIDMYGNSSSKTLTALKSHSISHNAIVTTPIVERHTHVYKHQQSSPTILDDTKSRGSKMQNNDLVKKTDETHSPTPETSSISSITKRIKGMFGNVVGKSEKSKPVENSVTGEQKERIRKIMAKLKQAKKQEPILFELVESEDLCVIKKILKSVAARVDITEICIGNESYSDSGSESESDSEADSESEYEYDYEIGTSLLHVAVEHRDYDVVEYLVNEQGFGKVLAKPNFQTLVRDCMEEIAEPDIRTFDQKCMILELLFNKCPSLIESRDDDQSTPLHLATETDFSNGKQVELIKRLLCRNTNVNAKDGKGFTPLHLAVCEDGPKNVIDIIHLLFAHHADPNVKDNDGRSFLHIAAKNVPPRIFQEIIMYLVSMDMTNCFNIHDTDGCTVLHVAVMYMKGDPLEETLQLLKTHGVNFNAVDYVSDSVMFKAIAGGRNESFLNTLIRFGADWTILNINNNTALHYAACYNNFSAIKMFIRFNCDVNAKDKDGDTPLHEAINYSDTPSYDVIHELLVNGADPRLQNNKKQSTIHIAQQKISLQKIDHRTLQLLVNYSY